MNVEFDTGTKFDVKKENNLKYASRLTATSVSSEIMNSYDYKRALVYFLTILKDLREAFDFFSFFTGSYSRQDTDKAWVVAPFCVLNTPELHLQLAKKLMKVPSDWTYMFWEEVPGSNFLIFWN